MTQELEAQIDAWRGYVAGQTVMRSGDVAELEEHLRDQVDALIDRGLAEDEAFLVAIKRLGRLDEVSREFAREHSDRLWKQLVIADDADAPVRSRRLPLAIVLALLAAVAVKVPQLLGVPLGDEPAFYLRNAALLTLPFLAAYFLVRRGASTVTVVAVAASFVAAGLVMNLYPFVAEGDTLWLAAAAVFVALWAVVGIAYVGGDWASGRARMDFVRFTGEWFVYLVLLVLGGGVLSALTLAVFAAIGLNPSAFVGEWLIPCGGAAAIVIAAWLVEAKQSVIENIAPVLTKVFTPLFTVLLLALIAAGILQLVTAGGDGVSVFGAERDLLIIFDLVLVVVVALLLYSLSAREPAQPAGWFDRLQLLMVAAALIVDVIVLAAMIERIGSFGASPNKLASLGLNLILLVNLVVAAWLQLRFVRGRTTFGRVERWQTTYVPVYLAWAVVVVVVLPPVFGFR